MTPAATETEAVELTDLTNLAESGQRQKLRLVLNDLHPADLAVMLTEMQDDHRLSCFRLLDLDHASEVLSELDTEVQANLLRSLGDIGIVSLISRMSPNDAVDLLAELPEEKASAIISQIPDSEAKEDLEELMKFEQDTAGGIMSTDYLSVFARMTSGEALLHLRDMYEDLEEDIYDIYVVDETNGLVGHLGVKELITADPMLLVADVMDTTVVSVKTSTDQEEAAETLGHYDLLSLPVIDEFGKLRGIIMADDIIDVLKEEANEDAFQSSGISSPGGDSQEMLGHNVGKAFGARLPWLIATLMIETGAATVITHYDSVIRDTVAAASFMPLLSGVTGSVATQSTCIIIRGTKDRNSLNTKLMVKNLFHEIKVGLLLAVLCGACTFLISMLFNHSHPQLGIIVSASLILTMTVGVVIGTIMPMFFQKIGIDPAHASGPLITSILDVSTMTIYLTIVHFFRASLT
ncbi:MAG: magnesium transporter [Candidatus Melainabacteria bacterium]|nr:magnesium transporter [Candidatus Melainabacteria bacterium]